MPVNRVTITLEAKDLTGPTLRKLNSSLDNLGGSFGRVGGQARGLGSSLSSSMAMGVVAGNAVIATIGAIGAAAGRAATAVADLFKDYANTQQQGILTAGSVMGALEVSFDDARSIVRSFTSELSKQTSLYGADLSKVQEASSVALDDLLKVFTETGMQQDAAGKRAATVFTKLQAVAGSDLTNMQLSQVIPNLIENELDASKDFFNSQIKGYMEEYLGTIGATLDSSTAEQRVKALEFALQKKLPDQVVAQMQGSVNGIMASFKNAFFNIDTGILALDRDLDPKREGIQSVGASFTRVVKKIFGSGGLFDAIGKLLQEMGFDNTSILDVMAGALAKVGQWVEGITRFINNINGQDFRLPDGDFNFARIGQLVGEAINGLVNQFNVNITPVEGAEAGNQLGAKIAEAVYGFIDTFDAEAAMQALGTIVIAAISATASTVGGLIAAAIVDLGTDFYNNSVREFNTVSNALTNFLNTISRSLNEGINAAISAFNSINWLPDIPQIGPAAQIAPADVNQGTVSSPVGNSSTTTSPPSAASVRGAYQGNIPFGVPSLLSAMLREQSNAPSGAEVVLANTSELILNRRGMGVLAENISQIASARVTTGTAPFHPNASLPATRSESGPSFNFGDIHVSSNASDPKQVAMEVMAEIERRFSRYQQNQVTGVA